MPNQLFRIIINTLTVIMLMACNEHNEHSRHSINEIHVTIRGVGGLDRIYKNGASGPYVPFVPSIAFIEDDGRYSKYDLLDSDSTYNYTISTERQNVEVEFTDKLFSPQYFVLQSGDSLEIYSLNGEIRTSVLGDFIQDVSTSIDQNFKDDITPFAKLDAPFFFVDLDFSKSKEYNDSIVKTFIDLQKVALRDYVDVATSNISNRHAVGDLKRYQASSVVNRLQYYLRRNNLHTAAKASPLADEGIQKFQVHYQSLLLDTLISIGKEYPEVRTTNGSQPNHILILDHIYSKIEDVVLKRRLAMVATEQLIKSSATVDAKLSKLQQFNVQYSDTAFTQYLTDKYKLGFDQTSDELKLVSYGGDTVYLENVLLNSKHKVVYVDFWASWCRPCIEAFDASRELHKNTKNNVEMIYISIDNLNHNWIESVNIEKLDITKCYRVANPKSSRWMDSYNLHSIPRYMIMNRNGSIVNSMAPGPGEEVEQTLLSMTN